MDIMALFFNFSPINDLDLINLKLSTTKNKN